LKKFKVLVKAILQKSFKHIINVTYVLLKHITKTVNCEVLKCAARPLMLIFLNKSQ